MAPLLYQDILAGYGGVGGILALSPDWSRFPKPITPSNSVANRERHKTQKTRMTPSSLLSH